MYNQIVEAIKAGVISADLYINILTWILLSPVLVFVLIFCADMIITYYHNNKN